MTLNCKGNLIDLTTPKVMGILNITPDSFYDGGKYENDTSILEQVEKMLSEGAIFIDVGAYSSRPGADHITENEEKDRIVPVIRSIIKRFPEAILSIDTFRSTVASACLNEGASIINDISAGKQDDKMFEIVAQHQAPYIMMHMKGTPKNMQQNTNYKNLMTDILYYFSERLSEARAHKINDIIIDPGFGFSKTLEQNYELLRKMDLLNTLELPILVGVSRKSMIYKTLDVTPQEAMNGTTALNMIALQKGAKILRVHDVAEAIECITLNEHLN
ncbi:dihydropteroate synthase [Maribacter sp. HTCC2170]|uniref:dihydropteroate synthase n=1 Tax=Maribacter sp. (strain HTCC2170 / KCCM 42371) TaxID=313603 RepID=UPI00006BE083|nr:dihydropteroate synthase [Maribacter sp. HTCC2170]EAR00037.1 dihydropteroate synthase [Maribacter sp. HTCC2170]